MLVYIECLVIIQHNMVTKHIVKEWCLMVIKKLSIISCCIFLGACQSNIPKPDTEALAAERFRIVMEEIATEANLLTRNADLVLYAKDPDTQFLNYEALGSLNNYHTLGFGQHSYVGSFHNLITKIAELSNYEFHFYGDDALKNTPVTLPSEKTKLILYLYGAFVKAIGAHGNYDMVIDPRKKTIIVRPYYSGDVFNGVLNSKITRPQIANP